MILNYTANKNDIGKHVKSILKTNFDMSTRLITKLKFAKNILVNNSSVFLDYLLKENDVITIKIDFCEPDNIVPQNISINILYEDSSIIAINKPPFIVCHPTSMCAKDTMANAIKFYLQNKKEYTRCRFINRLDRDTSGILLFAKNEYIHDLMAKQMNKNTFTKQYIGIVNGIPKSKFGEINLPINRNPNSIMLREISNDGLPSITHYEVLNEYPDQNYSMVKFILETGRTHQIRVHCKSLGNPILGDTLYGESSNYIDRQALHAYYTSFFHPITGKLIEITADLPEDMKKLVFPYPITFKYKSSESSQDLATNLTKSV